MARLYDTIYVNILSDPFDKKREWSLLYGTNICVFRNKKDALLNKEKEYLEMKKYSKKWSQKCFKTIKVIGKEINIHGLNILTISS